MKNFFEENWIYRIMVILSLCILLVYTYLTNENTLLNYLGGEFILDTRLIWQVGIFALLSLVLFYLLESALDYKSQNEVLKEYIRKIQAELENERDAVKGIKSESSDKILQLGSFIVAISDMAKELNSVLETTPLLKTIMLKTAQLLGSTKCAIFSVGKSKQKFHLIDAIGYNEDKLSNLDLAPNEASGMIGIAAQDGRLYSQDILSNDYNKKHILKNDKLKLQFCQPITCENETLAVICVGDVRGGLSNEYIIRILSTLANFAAVAITNTALVEKIKDQSIKDGLTGLYNHQHFQEKLDELLKRSISDKKPLGFIMLDLDYFKKLNDTYGHQMGDLGLKKLAAILKKRSRESDIIARYGGEEFVCVLPERNLEEAVKLAEEIRNDFKNTIFEFEGIRASCTLSAGVSAYLPDTVKSIKKNLLIKSADMALYEAKEKGRDMVVFSKGA